MPRGLVLVLVLAAVWWVAGHPLGDPVVEPEVAIGRVERAGDNGVAGRGADALMAADDVVGVQLDDPGLLGVSRHPGQPPALAVDLQLADVPGSRDAEVDREAGVPVVGVRGDIGVVVEVVVTRDGVALLPRGLKALHIGQAGPRGGEVTKQAEH